MAMEVFLILRIGSLLKHIVGGSEGVGPFVSLSLSMKNGLDYNFSIMKLPVHAGTHVDAPGHMFAHYFDTGFYVDTLDLDILNGIELGNYIFFKPLVGCWFSFSFNKHLSTLF